eukprot:m.71598 g.71598  ORF g.71598 m.71598 type:complete len:262 (+) comp12264_c0_seq1:185-970(+)
MAATLVRLTADSMLVCLSHALSTEREEVMGLLVGEQINEGQSKIIQIVNLLILQRIDKRKDRVEISAEQLGMASTRAEELGKECGRDLRIVGWYHSHPHITVWPSHVDVRTQFQYQLMDSTFVGLIFSAFSDDENKVGKIEATCFQSEFNEGSTSYVQKEIPLEIVQGFNAKCNALETLKELPKNLLQEEHELLQAAQSAANQEMQVLAHNSAVYTAAVYRLLDRICAPMLRSMECRALRTEAKARELEKKRDALKTLLAK